MCHIITSVFLEAIKLHVATGLTVLSCCWRQKSIPESHCSGKDCYLLISQVDYTHCYEQLLLFLLCKADELWIKGEFFSLCNNCFAPHFSVLMTMGWYFPCHTSQCSPGCSLHYLQWKFTFGLNGLVLSPTLVWFLGPSPGLMLSQFPTCPHAWSFPSSLRCLLA